MVLRTILWVGLIFTRILTGESVKPPRYIGRVTVANRG